VRREFVSNVPGQSCAPEIEAELAGPLKAIAESLETEMKFADDPAATENAAPKPVDR